jgi:hypothetical protein
MSEETFNLIAISHYSSLITLALYLQARSSVGERFLDTEEVGGSIPPVPILEFGLMLD